MNQPGSLKVDITGLEKCYLVWWVLIPGCNIWMAGSEFCLNIKVWIYPAFYQQERLFLVVMWGIYCDNCILINYLNISSTTICIQSWPALPSPVLMAALWGQEKGDAEGPLWEFTNEVPVVGARFPSAVSWNEKIANECFGVQKIQIKWVKHTHPSWRSKSMIFDK